jgi:predicted flap endonuclease-1-like 5' DNA nuclease
MELISIDLIKIFYMTNNWLLTLIIVLSVLTIIHIAYYLLQLTKLPKAKVNINNINNRSLTSTTTSNKLLPDSGNTTTPTKPTPTSTPTAAEKIKDAQNVFYTQSDNFQKIEGIGPAIEETLKTAGVRTYKQLSESDYSTLKSILMSKGSKFVMHDPRNWPKQAKLAYEGKWDELEKLKIELIRGK